MTLARNCSAHPFYILLSFEHGNSAEQIYATIIPNPGNDLDSAILASP